MGLSFHCAATLSATQRKQRQCPMRAYSPPFEACKNSTRQNPPAARLMCRTAGGLFMIFGTGIDGAGTVDLLTQQHTGKLVRKGEAGEADPACGGRLDLWG